MRLSFVLLLLVFLVLPGKSSAQSKGGVSVTPVFQEITVSEEDARADFSITLRNETDAPAVLRPSVVDFGSLDESGGVAFLGQAADLKRKYALASWMRPEKDVVFLGSGETEELHIVIENRDSLSPGGHYGAVLFRIGNENDGLLEENTVAVQEFLSVLVFAKKKGGEIYNLALKDILLPKNPFLLPHQTVLRFQNDGNIHLVPRGRVTLTDPLGREVKKGVLNQESGLLFPETLRNYTVSLESLASAFLPGKYTLTVSYRYDGKDEFMLETKSGFFIPWQGVVGALFIGTLLFLFRNFLIKRRLSGTKK